MAPAQSKWDDEDESTPPSSPPATGAISRRKFDDEEEDSDVVESWDAADDSEEEAERQKKAAQLKAKAEAEAAAKKKSKAQRIAEHQAARKQAEEEEEETSSEEEEDEAERRERLRRTEKDADLKHAEDLFGEVGISSSKQRSSAAKPVVTQDPRNPEQSLDLSSLPIFKPTTKAEFDTVRETLVPLITANVKKPHYASFLSEFAKQLAKDLPSGDIKKLSSVLATLSNEKMKEEKAAEKGGKKTKAAKTKTSLVASRDTSHKADITAYDDGLDEDDFM